ncbi:MAG TPA: hypothetical protein DET40_17270 [Lentisphaeria bacterium]|nr:MAG: hypothetical protein A2X45_02735 [Lentisphaerae bacterium GWF2_50_93]HCE45293.1 hypothetical protein [Lentisphaeria bacterium]
MSSEIISNGEKVKPNGISAKLRTYLPSIFKVLPCFGLAAVICAYAYVETITFTPAYREIDCEGYLLLAKRMSHGGPLALKDDDIFYYQNHVWVENERGEVSPKFAPGYPAVMAVFYKIGGDVAMFWVSPVCGALTLIGAFLLFRLWMSSFTAVIATACLAANKMFLFYTGYLLTHSLDICAATWGMYFLFKWRRGGRWVDALGSGLILGFACTVRFTEVLMAIVIGIALLSRLIPYLGELIRYHRKKGEISTAVNPGYRSLLSIGVLIGSYAIFPCILLIYNKMMFGSFMTTGYYYSNEQHAYTWAQLVRMYPEIWAGMSREGLFLTFEVGLVAILVFGPWSEGLMRVFWVLPLILLHASYYWAGGGMAYIRFFISLFPAFIGTAFAVVDKVSLTASRKYFAVVIFAAMVIGFRIDHFKTGNSQLVSSPGSRAVAACAGMLSKSLNPDAVILSDWNCGSYLGTLCQFRYYNLDVFTSKYGSRSGWGIGVRQQEKRLSRLRDFYRSHSETELLAMKKTKIEDFMSGGRQVVYLMRPDRQARELAELGKDYELASVSGFDTSSVQWPELKQFGLFELKKKQMTN